jgi:hypothetical protein
VHQPIKNEEANSGSAEVGDFVADDWEDMMALLLSCLAERSDLLPLFAPR